MFIHYKNKFPELSKLWDTYEGFQEKIHLPAKHVLLREGETAKYYYYIQKGGVRAYLRTNTGEEKTVQFFFETDGLSSFESFMRAVPSAFYVETLEPTEVTRLPKEKVLELFERLKASPSFMDMVIYIFSDRQIHYMNEFVSFLKDSPTERFENLIRERPHILQRVPQHYIASYLGVSSVHLSRIKAKLAGKH